MHQSQEPQQADVVKHQAEKQNPTLYVSRRPYRPSVKPSETDEIIRCKSNTRKKSEILRECFGSDSEIDCHDFAEKDTPDTNINSKQKKSEGRKCDFSEKLENSCNTENKYRKLESQSPHSKNESKSKLCETPVLRRSNRSPVIPRRYEPDIIKSTQKRNKKLGKRYSLNAKEDCQPKYNSRKRVPLKLEVKESNRISLTKEKPQLQTPVKNVKISPKARLITPSAKKKETKIEYPTSEEIAEIKRRENEQMRTNSRMKAILKDLIQVPKKVKILSLDSMTAEEILETFPIYKDHLDVIFRELHLEPKVTGYNEINHYSVIELIDSEKQLKMMHKLGEIYETDHDGVSMYPMLFANALMPEWLIYIFKDKYNLSYCEAVTHLHKQRQYMEYMEKDNLY